MNFKTHFQFGACTAAPARRLVARLLAEGQSEVELEGAEGWHATLCNDGSEASAAAVLSRAHRDTSITKSGVMRGAWLRPRSCCRRSSSMSSSRDSCAIAHA